MTWVEPLDSDKHYWHRYSRFYENHFQTLGSVSSILEYGVFKGASIRWLRQMFPQAEILAVDILPPQPEWPVGPGITYITADQSDRSGISGMLRAQNRSYDLVIEDGSHIPQHQAACLAETFPLVRPGGLYVLEDLQTSHPQHAYFTENCTPGTPTSVHLLLWIEHLRATGKTLQTAQQQRLAGADIFTPADVQNLSDLIADVDIYHRTTLPLSCYACGTDRFDPVALTCQCGTNLDILGPDSMTAVLRRVVTPTNAPA